MRSARNFLAVEILGIKIRYNVPMVALSGKRLIPSVALAIDNHRLLKITIPCMILKVYHIRQGRNKSATYRKRWKIRAKNRQEGDSNEDTPYDVTRDSARNHNSCCVLENSAHATVGGVHPV